MGENPKRELFYTLAQLLPNRGITLIWGLLVPPVLPECEVQQRYFHTCPGIFLEQNKNTKSPVNNPLI